MVADLKVYHGIYRSIFYIAYVFIRHKILLKCPYLIGHHPAKVGLVVCVHAAHQFKVWAVFISQVFIPCLSKFATAPCPLLFTRTYMMIGHVHNARLFFMMIATHKIEFTINGHVRSGHRNICVNRNISTGRIVYFIISARCNEKRTYISFAMVIHGMHIGWKHTLVMFVYRHGGVRPPQKGLRKRCAVVQFGVQFNISSVGIKGKPKRAFGTKHFFILVYPHGFAAVGIFFYKMICWFKGRWPVVLRPVKLNAAADPRPGKRHKRRLYYLVVIHKMIIVGFIIRHLDAAAKFRQYHHFQVIIL